MACIAGAVAEAFFGSVPSTIEEQVLARLDDRLRLVLHEFTTRFILAG
jgi:ADP-ribosylglycohydrolase